MKMKIEKIYRVVTDEGLHSWWVSYQAALDMALYLIDEESRIAWVVDAFIEVPDTD